jgi:hypothetical protein
VRRWRELRWSDNLRYGEWRCKDDEGVERLRGGGGEGEELMRAGGDLFGEQCGDRDGVS